jgi:hypothetical protein
MAQPTPKDWAAKNKPREGETKEQYKARYVYETDEGVPGMVEQFARGGALGLSKTASSMLGGIGYLTGSKKLRDYAREKERINTEFYNPQGKMGTAGELIGRGAGELATSRLGAGLVLQGATKLASKAGGIGTAAKAVKAGLESKSAVGRALATAAVGAPVDILQGAAQDNGMLLKGRTGAMLENTLFSATGGAGSALLASRAAKKAAASKAGERVAEMMNAPDPVGPQRLLGAGTPGATPYTGPSSSPRGPAIPMGAGGSREVYPFAERGKPSARTNQEYISESTAIVPYRAPEGPLLDRRAYDAGQETGEEVAATLSMLEKMSARDRAEWMAMNMPNVSEQELMQIMTARIPVGGARMPLTAGEAKSLRGLSPQRMRPRSGAASSEMLSTLAGGGVGALAGAETGETTEERLARGAAGGLAGLFLGSRAPRFFEGGATSRAPVGGSFGKEAEEILRQKGGKGGTKPSAASTPLGEVDGFPANREPLLERAGILQPAEKMMFAERIAAEEIKIPRPRTEKEWQQGVQTILKSKNASQLADELSGIDPKRATAEEAGAMLSLVSDMRNRRATLVDGLKGISDPDRIAQVADDIDALEETSTRLLSTLMKADTEAGRALQARAYAAQNISDPTYWHLKASREKGMIISQAERDQIEKLLGEGDNTKVLQYLATIKKSSKLEQAAQLRSAGLLAGLPGRARDLVSTSANYVSTVLQRYPGALADIAASKYAAKKLGGVADQYRTVALPSSEEAKAAFNGAGQGLRMAAESMGFDAAKKGGLEEWVKFMRQAEIDPEMAKTLDIPSMINIDMFSGLGELGEKANTFADVYSKSVMRFSGLTDKIIKQSALQGALQEQASLLALRKGYKGQQAKDFAAKLMKAPTDDMMMDAKLAADVITFTNDGTLAGGIANAITAASAFAEGKRKGGGALVRAASRFAMPFRRTPANILSRAIEYTPGIGWAKTAIAANDWTKELANTALEGVTKNRAVALRQRKLVDMLTKNVTGLGMFALGAELYNNGVLTGEAPSGAEMEQWRLEGKTPESILIGKEWIPISRISPYGGMMTLAASVLQKNKSGTEQGVGAALKGMLTEEEAVQTMSRSLLNQPMLTGPKDILEATMGRSMQGDNLGSYAKQQAGSLIPTGIAQLARSGGEQYLPQSIGQEITSRIPGLQGDTPVRLNVFGEPVQKPSGVFNTAISPLPASQDLRESDPMIGELSRVGANIGALQRGKGETIEMYQYRQREAGKFLREDLTALFQSPEYLEADPTEQRRLISKVSEDGRRELGRLLKESYQIDTPPEE